MTRLLYFTFFLCFTLSGFAQNFMNGDLEGTISTSNPPPYWSYIPDTDPCTHASGWSCTTSDITGLSGPMSTHGISGKPHSGNTFVCGLCDNCFQEGIMQTISGFTVGCTYKINFYQANVKQTINYLDTSGCWIVYADNTLIDTSAASISHKNATNTNLDWEHRSIVFVANNTVHTIKFLPFDDDPYNYHTGTPMNGSVRMGIDSIYIEAYISGIDISDTSICVGDSILLNAISPNGNYVWNNGSTSSSIFASQEGVYSVNGSSICGSFQDSIVISHIIMPNLYLGADTLICDSNGIILDAGANNYTFNWSNGDTSQQTHLTNSGIYWLEMDTAGCKVSDTIEVKISHSKAPKLNPNYAFCKGDSTELSVGLWSQYLWSTQDSTNIIFVKPNSTTQYNLDVWDTYGCHFHTNTKVSPIENPTLQIAASHDTLCRGNIVVFKVSGADLYLWDMGSTSATIALTPNASQTYRVTGENSLFDNALF